MFVFQFVFFRAIFVKFLLRMYIGHYVFLIWNMQFIVRTPHFGRTRCSNRTPVCTLWLFSSRG